MREQGNKVIVAFSNSKDDHDGNENVKKAIVLLTRKTTLHVHHTFSHISLPPLHEVKMSNSTFYLGRKQETTKFSFSFLCGPQEINSGTSYTWHFQQFGTRQSLKKHELILNVTFSLPLPSSMLKLPIFFRGRGRLAQAILKGPQVLSCFKRETKIFNSYWTARTVLLTFNLNTSRFCCPTTQRCSTTVSAFKLKHLYLCALVWSTLPCRLLLLVLVQWLVSEKLRSVISRTLTPLPC